MERTRLTASVLIVMLLFLLPAARAAAALEPTVTQSISLNPGWNAVYLDVQPLSNLPSEVFRDLPAGSSVWAWTGKQESAEFIQDPGEAPFKMSKWLSIFTDADKASLNNFYAIHANSAYLVELPGGTPPLTLTIAGKPTLRHKAWIPDSFNLVGFDFSSPPPTFGTFFAPSLSHKNQAIYRLNNSGTWELVSNPGAVAMRSGEAFWIYCQAGSDYQGPLAAEAEGVDGLDFGEGITVLKLTLNNFSSSDRNAAVSQLVSTSPVPLAFRKYDPGSGLIVTRPLAEMPPLAVRAGGSTVLTLAVQRGDFSGSAASVLEVTDGAGLRVRVPVTASSNRSASYPGLWSGAASINRVSQLVDSGAAPDFLPGEPKPTPSEMNLNLILHQDGTGQVRLLKQAIVMYRDPTYNADGTKATNGRYVVLTDDKLIPNYSGVTLRDNAKVGRRLSAVAFDYSPSADTEFENTALRCSGVISGEVVCRMVLEFIGGKHPSHEPLSAPLSSRSR